ncbi:MAG: hypothetical protein AAGF82_01240, partial [Pseudomonadota bacterium]
PEAAEPPEDAPEPDQDGDAFIEEDTFTNAISSHAIEASTPPEEDAETAPDAAVEPAAEAAPADADEPIAKETVEASEVQPALADLQEEQEPEPVAEARIEVPVQQQFASLLSALSDRVQKHPGGHDLLAVLRMLEGQQIMSAGVLLHAVAQCGQKGGKLLLNRDFDPGFGNRFLFLLFLQIRQRRLDFRCLDSLLCNGFIRICRCRFRIRLHCRIRFRFRVFCG